MSNPTKFIDNRQFHKSNYDKALEYIIPKMYFEQDYSQNEKEIDILDQVINSHLNVIYNIKNIIDISAIQGSIYSSINTADGISKFFIKQNNLTNLNINDFETNILIPLNKSFRDFKTSSEFSTYLTDTLLPSIQLNKPTVSFTGNTNASANHIYLIEKLSWLYFLNFSSASYSPSDFVHDILVDKIYRSENVNLNDGIKGLTEYIWRNYSNKPNWQQYKLIPDDLRPPEFINSNSYTDGTNQLERLKTLVDIIYSPLYIDDGDTRVKDAIDNFLTISKSITEKIYNGPFIKLIKAISFAIADYSNSIDKLEFLNDLDECPDEFLPYIADLIGWRLFGSEPKRWRLQIINALDVYKITGTKKSLQLALNSVLGRQNFNVSSKITELWESYVPNLIYYSLATESSRLKDFNTWTRQAAQDLGIEQYSSSSLDENVRLCTDKILYDLVLKFPEQFRINSNPFPVQSQEFTFNYRNRDYKIPPFEEIPYYLNVTITNDLIDVIIDKLICFGVGDTFAFQVGDFIREKTILTDTDANIKNGFLIYTNDAQYPPNWNSIISDISNKKAEYLPLWSGKSSYFKVLFDASSFDFTRDSLDVDSKEVLKIASQIAKDFSPAHAIPNVIARIDEIDNFYEASNVVAYHLLFNKLDFPHLNNYGFGSYGASAFAMNTYKRGIQPNSPTFTRDLVDSYVDQLMYSGVTTSLPRNNHRRRDFKNTLPTHGYYDRTGFNPPTFYDTYSGTLGFTLGLIPQSLQFVGIPDYTNIPSIYDKCENLNSPNSYSGVVVSSTFPFRGWRSLGSNSKSSDPINRTPDAYCDLGQLHPIVALMHRIKEKQKILEASSYFYQNQSKYLDFTWKNVLQSYANSSTEFNGNFPNSKSDYEKFSFGKDFFKLFHQYITNFGKHKVTKNVLDLDGPTIFAHAFGSIFTNSKLTEKGNQAITNPDIVASSLDNPIELTNGSKLFSYAGIASGAYIASSVDQIPVNGIEIRNSGIINYVEFTQTSGTSYSNSFTILGLNKFKKNKNINYNELLYDNVVIKQRSVDGLGRIRFDLGKYSQDLTKGYAVTKNFLTQDHDFSFTFKSLISDMDGVYAGGGDIGVWIHTRESNGYVWSYTKNKTWVRHAIAGLTKDYLINNFNVVNALKFKERNLDDNFNCARILDLNNPNRLNDLLGSFTEEEFTTLTINFNTKNTGIFDPVYGQVHNKDQNYIIEVFKVPSVDDKFALFYDFNLIDLTLNKQSKFFVTGISNGVSIGDNYCKEFRVDLSKEEVYTIIKYFNELAGTYSNFGYGSKVAAYTSGVYLDNGGSRINYVESPYWSPYTKTTTNFINNLTFIN